jgi:predicted transcriptional regulator
MVIKVVYPQEIVVWHVLPLLRRELSIEMKSLGLDQKKIASLLSVTGPAISQYFNDKRANQKIKINQKLRSDIKNSAKNIIENPEEIIFEIQKLLSTPEIKTLICSIHKKDFNAPKNCQMCKVGAK